MDEEHSSSDEEVIILRKPRYFRNRISYNVIQETYDFTIRFRLNFQISSFILERIDAHLEHPTHRNLALIPHQQLQIALHWLGTGAQYHSISDIHDVSKTTISKVVHKVVNAVEATLVDELVCWPDDVGDVVNDFSKLAVMPLV
ncbi:hypothetical protein PR048_020174 [Dryococelus australis]|uniref:Nuclease HARBI1 n=1 Tax=Dryococelus australis TaxID=614101 RepID=A0ABQ9H5K8_9NEOP|nr:hypothetical protein PR048_020174 [Dryococelus australis]